MSTDLNQFFARTLLGQDHFSEERAAALSQLMAASRQGDLAIPKERLNPSIDSLPSSIVAEGEELFPKAPIIRKGGLYYLQRNWVYETHLVREVKRLSTQPPPSWIDRSRLGEELFAMPLNEAQRGAIQKALHHSFSIICGGPGSGKTYTASLLIALLASSKKRLKVILTAPTGKAAFHLHAMIQKRGVEAHLEAMTLHRLLRLQPGEERLFSPTFLDADVVLVDEASMIDVPLMAHLLESIGKETLFLLIGDPHQLPPVDGGSLFAEMAHLFGSSLTQCMRTEEEGLKSLARSVKEGKEEEFFSTIEILDQQPDLYEWIAPLLSGELPDPNVAMQTYEKRRILNPIRQGVEGVDHLNARIWKRVLASGLHWAVPILATVNDSWEGVYNGMNGILIGEPGRPLHATAWFPDPATGEMRAFSSPPPHELAFCLSVHKSQGCEYEEVLALFPTGSDSFGKEGLYTAITRAKKRLSLCGSRDLLAQMIKTCATTHSDFTNRLRRLLHNP